MSSLSHVLASGKMERTQDLLADSQALTLAHAQNIAGPGTVGVIHTEKNKHEPILRN